MEALIERLEKATGPDARLDRAIAIAVDAFSPPDRGSPVGDWLSYTRSIDAALTLVPEGFAIDAFQIWPGEPSRLTLLETRRERFGAKQELAWVHGLKSSRRWDAKAATAAIALCIAALKARAATSVE